MAQSEGLRPNTEIEKAAERAEAVLGIAAEGYYKKPQLVRFLMIENLAMKQILSEKGIITPEEFKKHTEQAAAILDAEVRRQLDDWKRKNPKEAVLLDILAGKINSPDASS